MDERLQRLIPYGLSAIFLGMFFFFLNAHYPLIGQDYFYFFPRLLAGRWHFAHAGLLPFRYIPFLCGGLPLYGNPQDLSYSLLQLLALWMDLWWATMLTIGVTVVVGYFGWVHFGIDCLRISKAWAHVLALIIIANGYYVLHLTVGHLQFITTPLIGWMLWFLFDPRRFGMKMQCTRACWFGLLSACVLYAAGIFVLLQTAMLALLLFPVALFVAGGEWKTRLVTLCTKLSWYGPAAILICASKFTAIVSYMRFFPRLTGFNHYETTHSIFLFIAKVLWLMPQYPLALDTDRYPSELHEYSMFTSPIVIVGLLIVIIAFVRRLRTERWQKSLAILVYVCAILLLFAQLERGYGFLADAIHALPVFSSWRMNPRFLYLFAILLSIAGTWGLARMTTSPVWKRRENLVAGGASLLTIACFFAAYWHTISPAYMDIVTPYDQVLQTIHMHPDFTRQAVTEVKDYRNGHVSDFEYVLAGTTGFSCYEPLIDASLFTFVAGPVGVTHEGGYNLNNPACYQYPEANHCRPGDRIDGFDVANFERFVSGAQPMWPLSVMQRIADVVSLGSLILFGLFLAAHPAVQHFLQKKEVQRERHQGGGAA